MGGNSRLPAEVSVSYVGSESICISLNVGQCLDSKLPKQPLLAAGVDVHHDVQRFSSCRVVVVVVAFCSLWTMKKTWSGGLKPAVSSETAAFPDSPLRMILL